VRLLVKVSQASFGDPHLIELIARELAAHGVPGQRLWLETTEAKVFTHLRGAQDLLAAATELGCKLGLEQFGTGLDSFQLLAHFTPAFLKLDRSFCQDQRAPPKPRTRSARSPPTPSAMAWSPSPNTCRTRRPCRCSLLPASTTWKATSSARRHRR